METKGLLFIPDIIGFTRFVTESEINHSRLIIQELLELLINANQIGLEVSEIEGDAILFYKFGETPQLDELYKQVEKMFYLFHKNLLAYDQRKYCQCKACTSAAGLSLKVITHYGEFTGYNVKNFSKLIGKE
jgi:predicted nucleic-acid-binding protein